MRISEVSVKNSKLNRASGCLSHKTLLVLIVYVSSCDLLDHKLLGKLNDRAEPLDYCRQLEPSRSYDDDRFGPDSRCQARFESRRGPSEEPAATINCSPPNARFADDNQRQINESQETGVACRRGNNGASALISQSNHRPTQNRRPLARKHSWSIVGLAEAIRLIRLEAPHSTQTGQPIRLRCLYETRGDKLLSMSWYRNGREFYRYQPFERREPVLVFNTSGIHVDKSRSKNNTVFLVNTTTETSGRYRCEATGTTFQEANLETTIEVLPASSSNAVASCRHSLAIMASTYATTLAASMSYSNHIRRLFK